jgi:hypothetical protein
MLSVIYVERRKLVDYGECHSFECHNRNIIMMSVVAPFQEPKIFGLKAPFGYF